MHRLSPSALVEAVTFDTLDGQASEELVIPVAVIAEAVEEGKPSGRWCGGSPGFGVEDVGVGRGEGRRRCGDFVHIE